MTRDNVIAILGILKTAYPYCRCKKRNIKNNYKTRK